MKSFNEFLLEAYNKQDDDNNTHIIHLDEKALEAILKLVEEEDEDDDLVKKLIKIIKEISKTVDDHVLVFDHVKVIEDKLHPEDEDEKDDDDESSDEDSDESESEGDDEEDEESEAEVPAGDVINSDSSSDGE